MAKSHFDDLQTLLKQLDAVTSDTGTLTFDWVNDRLLLIEETYGLVREITGLNSPEMVQFERSRTYKRLRRDYFIFRVAGRERFEENLSHRGRPYERVVRGELLEDLRRCSRVLKAVLKKYAPTLLRETTAVQDAKVILSLSTKTNFVKAAGLLVCLEVSRELRRVLNKVGRAGDDIMDLYQELKSKSLHKPSLEFLKRNYRRFENARNTRHRCTHVDREDPTITEVQSVIELAQNLNKGKLRLK